MITFKTILALSALFLVSFLTLGCDQAEEFKKGTFDYLDQSIEKARESLEQVKDKVDQLKTPAPQENANDELPKAETESVIQTKQ